MIPLSSLHFNIMEMYSYMCIHGCFSSCIFLLLCTYYSMSQFKQSKASRVTHDSQVIFKQNCPERDSNPRPPAYMAGTLPTNPPRHVLYMYTHTHTSLFSSVTGMSIPPSFSSWVDSCPNASSSTVKVRSRGSGSFSRIQTRLLWKAGSRLSRSFREGGL